MFKNIDLLCKEIWFAITAVFLILLLIKISFDSNVIFNLIYGGGRDAFMDFFNPIAFIASAEPYLWSRDACYSSLPFNLYLFIAKIINVVPETGGKAIKLSVSGMQALYIYTVITAALFSAVVLKMKKGANLEKLFFLILIIFSSPYIFQFERANIVFIVNILIMVFLICYQSSNKRIFEIGIITLAAAAVIKIYPAIFVLFFINNKNWKAIFRFAVYWVFLFFIPFFSFGGFERAKEFINSLLTLNTYAASGITHANSLSFHNFLLVSFDFVEKIGVIAKVANVVLFVSACFSFFFLKEYWKKVAILLAIVILCMAWSMQYTAIFMTAPLILFLDSNNKSKKEIVFSILFAGCFITLVFKNSNYLANSVIVEEISILLMCIFLIFEGFYRFHLNLRAGKKSAI